MKPKKCSYRAFFALPIAFTTQQQIDHWRRHRLRLPRPVPWSNYHLTLSFIGPSDDTLISDLCCGASHISVPAFSLALDNPGYFAPRRKRSEALIWLGPKDIPEPLQQLAQQLRQLNKKLGGHSDHKQFRPHLTLYRHHDPQQVFECEAPSFIIECGSFCLFRSVDGKDGVRYEPIQCWPLEKS